MLRPGPIPTISGFGLVCAISIAATLAAADSEADAEGAEAAEAAKRPPAHGAEDPSPGGDRHFIREVRGWTVRVNERLRAENPRATEVALELLEVLWRARDTPQPDGASAR